MRNYTPWTTDEKRFLRAHYGKRKGPWIARQLGRPLHQVYAAAERFGLSTPTPRTNAANEDAVRRLNAAGLTDAEIVRELKSYRRVVRNIRKRLGLPPSREGWLRRRRDGVRKQRETLGITSAGQLRQLAYRPYAVENGWPEDCRPREVQILNVLADRGVPMTRLELAEAIGMRTDRTDRNGKPDLLKGNGPGGTYTASLARRGLVARLRRAHVVRGMGKGKGSDLYCLGPVALQLLERRASCKATETQ